MKQDTPQIALWAGQFGDEYLERNQVDYQTRMPFWRQIVDRTQCKSALEVGCSAGWNLMALRELGVERLSGMDVNMASVEAARAAGLFVTRGPATECASIRKRYDLVFTCGVLIHIAPEDLTKSMLAIASASQRYVLSVEYPASSEEGIEYRGQADALWKRPYGAMWQKLGMKMVDVYEDPEGFDKCRGWLMELA